MKLLCNRRQSHSGTVTTLRVVWIEIRVEINIVYIHGVTTLRVVWIEISDMEMMIGSNAVTTLRVVWIEIFKAFVPMAVVRRHHLAGGVD